MRTPIPLSDKYLIIRWISATDSGSTPANGSSRSMILGDTLRARAIDTLIFWPPESCRG